MANTIKQLVYMDKHAREAVSEAREHDLEEREEISRQKRVLHDRYMKKAEERLEKLKASNAEYQKTTCDQIEAHNKQQKERLKATLDKNTARLLDELFSEITSI